MKNNKNATLLKDSNDYANIKELLVSYDREGLYSFTHPTEADIISLTILNNYENKKNLKILDGTGGLGGNTISFSKYFSYVNTFEIDKSRFKMLKNNIEHLNLNNISLSNNDSVEYMLNNYEKFDIYFFDPPWGGPDYKKIKLLSFKMGNYNLCELVNILKNKITNKLLIFKLPFNYNLNEFALFDYKLYKIYNYFIIIILL